MVHSGSFNYLTVSSDFISPNVHSLLYEAQINNLAKYIQFINFETEFRIDNFRRCK